MSTIRLNLGCGNSPKSGYLNVDNRALPGVDLVRDVLRGIPFSDDTVDEVYSENFLEHVAQPEVIWLMNEIWRVLKEGGIAHHLVPMAGTTNFWQDPTHLSHWVPETLTYFEQNHHRNRYYGGAVRPWLIEQCETVPPTHQVMDIVLRKP